MTTTKITPPIAPEESSTTKEAVPSKRLKYIDRAKAIAMLCVVFGHINLFDYYGSQGYGNGGPVDMCRVFGLTALFQMPLFIFLSGMVISTKSRTIKETIRQIYIRFRILLMPFFLIGGLYTLWIRQSSLMDFMNGDSKMGYWYLWCLFCFYLLHYAYELLSTRIKNERRGVAFNVLWFVAITAILKIAVQIVPNADLLSITYLANLYPYFYMGVMTKKYNLSSKLFANNTLFTIGLILSFAFVISKSFDYYYPHAFQSFGIGMIMVVLSTLYKLENSSNHVLRLLDFIGKNTLDVYVFHYFLIAGFHNLWIGQWCVEGHYSVMAEVIMAGIPAVLFTVISIYIGKLVRQSAILYKIIFYK